MLSYRKKKLIEFITIFCLGGVMYGLIEVIFRGYTHWTMAITGGVVFSLLYFINLKMGTKSLILRGLIGCLVITLTEFLVGITVNLIFKMNVWDYSKMKGNILGQICPLFSLWWFVLSIPLVYLCVFLYWQMNKKFRFFQDFE